MNNETEWVAGVRDWWVFVMEFKNQRINKLFLTTEFFLSNFKVSLESQNGNSNKRRKKMTTKSV